MAEPKPEQAFVAGDKVAGLLNQGFDAMSQALLPWSHEIDAEGAVAEVENREMNAFDKQRGLVMSILAAGTAISALAIAQEQANQIAAQQYALMQQQFAMQQAVLAAAHPGASPGGLYTPTGRRS